MTSTNPGPTTTDTTRRRWWLWLLGGAIVVIVLAVGVPFAYIHFGSSDTPAPLSLSTGTTVAGSAGQSSTGGASAVSGPTDISGVWKVGDGSTAGYRVQETLMGQSTEAVGRTTAVTGSVTLTPSQVSAASFTVDLTKVTSDKSQRDGQFQGRIMQTSTFPNATFTLTQPVTLTNVPTDTTPVTVKATGDLTLHGVTKSVTVDLTAQRSGSSVKVSGTIPVTFSDYGINNPSGGPASVGDTGQIEFLLVLTR